MHKYLQHVGAGKEAALAMVPEEHREFCGWIELLGLPHVEPEKWAFEVALAWNWQTDSARVLPGEDRDYSTATESELCGTADIIGVTEDSVVILDVKTGFAYLGDPASHLQLLGYAVAAARAFGRKQAVVGFIFVDADGSTHGRARLLDETELAEAVARTRSVIDATQAEAMLASVGSPSAPVVGEHCKYCPAFLRCPAQVSLLKGVVDVDEIREEDMPVALLRIEAIEAALKKAQGIIDTWASARPILLPDGQVYGKKERSVELLNPEIGLQVLGDRYGPAVAATAVESKLVLTKKKLVEALRPLKTKEKGITRLEEEAVAAIAEAGGVSVKTTVSLGKYKPKPQLNGEHA